MPSPRKVTWKNKDGSSGTAYEVRYKDRAGARRSKQFPRKKEADEFAATIVSEVRSGRHVHDRDTVTLAEAAERWMQACERGRNGRDPVEPHTLRTYRLFVNNYIVPFIGGLRLNELTPVHVRLFRDQDLLGNKASRSMTKKVLGALSAICREAIADELLSVNPCIGIGIVTASRHKEKVRIPTKEEVRRIVERAASWLPGPPLITIAKGRVGLVRRRLTIHEATVYYTMLKFIISTGVRLSEARGAARAALDGRLRKFSVIQRADERNKIGPTKSGTSRRDLEIGEGMLADLQRWLVLAPKSDLLFPTMTGKPYLAQNFYRYFWLPLLVECGLAKRIEDAHGIRHETEFSVHDLRHFHASLMIEAGMSPKALQVHMGHSSINVTMDIYGHLFSDEAALAQRRKIIVGAVDGLLETASR